ncbi:hypothetical protein BKA62DRAFT_668774 [Auriculariales sp. MPI-PUGE-AT-0066]|nr:hypothetical protein BKA62DRAFT_668774 [Auriculariales sp. MPI-PUGE-AT-0066]
MAGYRRAVVLFSGSKLRDGQSSNVVFEYQTAEYHPMIRLSIVAANKVAHKRSQSIRVSGKSRERPVTYTGVFLWKRCSHFRQTHPGAWHGALPDFLRNHSSRASLRPPGHTISDDSAAMDDNGHPVSLAHELAAALMPEPSMSSRLLADEFGLEFDDEEESTATNHAGGDAEASVQDMADNVNARDSSPDQDEDPLLLAGTSTNGYNGYEEPPPEPVLSAEDQLIQLTKDLTTTDHFLTALRRIDHEGDLPQRSSTKGHARQASINPTEPVLEGVAAVVIRRLNDTAREREEQVRELLQCDREFQKLATEVGGMDVLAEVELLEHIEGLELPSGRRPPRPEHSRSDSAQLDELPEEEELEDDSLVQSPDTETEPEPEEEDEFAPPHLKRRQTESDLIPPPPPAARGPPSVKSALPELAYMRTLTVSVVSSLSVVQEHAQVGNAGANEAGRKLRALRNKLTTWRSEFESVERSRIRIDQWEQSLARRGRPLDARSIVQAELSAFERVLADAISKTQEIRAHLISAAS